MQRRKHVKTVEIKPVKQLGLLLSVTMKKNDMSSGKVAEFSKILISVIS
jgi:hypothetical protein